MRIGQNRPIGFGGLSPRPLVVVQTKNGVKSIPFDEISNGNNNGDDPQKDNILVKFLKWADKAISKLVF